MDRGAWRATTHGVAKSQVTEHHHIIRGLWISELQGPQTSALLPFLSCKGVTVSELSSGGLTAF